MRSLFFSGVEWVDIEHRKVVGVVDSMAWTEWNGALAAIVYFVADWRQLIISVTSPLLRGGKEALSRKNITLLF